VRTGQAPKKPLMRIPFDVATQFRCNPPPNSGGCRHLIPLHLATP